MPGSVGGVADLFAVGRNIVAIARAQEKCGRVITAVGKVMRCSARRGHGEEMSVFAVAPFIPMAEQEFVSHAGFYFALFSFFRSLFVASVIRAVGINLGGEQQPVAALGPRDAVGARG